MPCAVENNVLWCLSRSLCPQGWIGPQLPGQVESDSRKLRPHCSCPSSREELEMADSCFLSICWVRPAFWWSKG